MEKKIKYKIFGFRLNDGTIQLMNVIKKVNGKSWNLFIYKLLIEHINSNKSLYRAEIFKPIYSKFKKNFCEQCKCEEKIIRAGYYNRSNLEIHHIDGNIANNNKKNLKTLCQSCHGKQYPR